MKFLIAEDHFIIRNTLEKFFSPYGDCETVEDGMSALNFFTNKLLENDPFDLICLDLKMPKMHGQSVLEEIRQLEHEQGITEENRVKVIIITSYADKENVVKAIQEKCDAYLIKPVGKDKIKDVLESLKLI
jgi:two-component system chemotaxis response regulator CheY